MKKLVCLNCEVPVGLHCGNKGCGWVRCPKCKTVTDVLRKKSFKDQAGPLDSGAPA